MREQKSVEVTNNIQCNKQSKRGWIVRPLTTEQEHAALQPEIPAERNKETGQRERESQTVGEMANSASMIAGKTYMQECTVR